MIETKGEGGRPVSADVLFGLVITGVRSVSTIYNGVTARFKRVSRPGWGLILKYEGETIYTINGRQICLRHLFRLLMGIIQPLHYHLNAEFLKVFLCALLPFQALRA